MLKKIMAVDAPAIVYNLYPALGVPDVSGDGMKTMCAARFWLARRRCRGGRGGNNVARLGLFSSIAPMTRGNRKIKRAGCLKLTQAVWRLERRMANQHAIS